MFSFIGSFSQVLSRSGKHLCVCFLVSDTGSDESGRTLQSIFVICTKFGTLRIIIQNSESEVYLGLACVHESGMQGGAPWVKVLSSPLPPSR